MDFRRLGALRLGQRLDQQTYEALTRLGEVIHPFSPGGRADLEVLGKPVGFVANALYDPHLAPEGPEGKEVNIIRVRAPAMVHEEVEVVTHGKDLEVPDEAFFLSLHETCLRHRDKEGGWRRVPHLAAPVRFDIRECLASRALVGPSDQRIAFSLVHGGNGLEQAPQALGAATGPTLRLFRRESGLKISVLFHDDDELTGLLLEPLRLHRVLPVQVNDVVLRRNAAVAVRLIGVGDESRRSRLVAPHARLSHGHRHDPYVVPSSRTAHGVSEVRPEVQVRLAHGGHAALKAKDNDRAVRGDSG